MKSLFLFLLASEIPRAILAQNCSPLQIVWARATGEPPRQSEGIETREKFEAAAAKTPNKGYGSVGNTIVSNVMKVITGTTSYPVHYVANNTWAVSFADGAKDMSNHLRNAAKACPQQKYVLGGHSQGGYVTVQTIGRLPKEVSDRIIAVTMFGSPRCPESMRRGDRCRSYCNKGDFVCDPANAPPKSGKGTGAKAPGGKALGGSPKGAKHAGTGAIRRDVHIMAQLNSVGTTLQNDCGVEPPERGYETSNIASSHVSYVRDGIFIKAAICFIQKHFGAGRT